ncbi:hypothetical protein WME91_53015 [Sorangium sp. So ce269]
MPKPMSVFIEFHGDEGVLLNVLAEVLGCSLIREDRDVGTLYRRKVLDIEFVLFSDHGLDDDCDIRFTSCNYQLNITAFDVGLCTSSYGRMYESISVFIAERLSARLGSRTEVVANLQKSVIAFAP